MINKSIALWITFHIDNLLDRSSVLTNFKLKFKFSNKKSLNLVEIYWNFKQFQKEKTNFDLIDMVYEF